MNVLYWVSVILGAASGGFMGRVFYEYAQEHLFRRRAKRFLGFVRAVFPNAEEVTYSSIGPSDKKVLENIERRLRDAS